MDDLEELPDEKPSIPSVVSITYKDAEASDLCLILFLTPALHALLPMLAIAARSDKVVAISAGC
jgi:hypothetical protein